MKRILVGIGVCVMMAGGTAGANEMERARGIVSQWGMQEFLAPRVGDNLESVGEPSLPLGDPFHSTTLQESAPVQITGSALPEPSTVPSLTVPCVWTRWVAFAGVPGKPASHEGVDYVHDGKDKPHVLVNAAAAGVVAYVRTGCPQSAMFTRNTQLREAGAGWGNHVVLYHGKGIYTRYAHLAPGSIRLKPGDKVAAGMLVGEMGNSGRSEVRHLHFELGWKKTPFVTGKPSQSFDLVFDPKRFLKQ
jgi:murein DD-endopeptidase MepM/ murein hydrolase activator NlpD